MNDSARPIANKRVALLVEQEFDDGELFGPLEALRTAGADVAVVGATAPTEYRGMQGGEITSTISVGRARVEDFDAIVIPGGWAPGRMRMRHAMSTSSETPWHTQNPLLQSAMARKCLFLPK